MAMLQDHFVVNIAKRVKPATEPFGPYHEHHMRAELIPGCTKLEAIQKFDELRVCYPEPEFRVSLYSVVCRSSQVRCSGQ